MTFSIAAWTGHAKNVLTFEQRCQESFVGHPVCIFKIRLIVVDQNLIWSTSWAGNLWIEEEKMTKQSWNCVNPMPDLGSNQG